MYILKNKINQTLQKSEKIKMTQQTTTPEIVPTNKSMVFISNTPVILNRKKKVSNTKKIKDV